MLHVYLSSEILLVYLEQLLLQGNINVLQFLLLSSHQKLWKLKNVYFSLDLNDYKVKNQHKKSTLAVTTTATTTRCEYQTKKLHTARNICFRFSLEWLISLLTRISYLGAKTLSYYLKTVKSITMLGFWLLFFQT